MGNYNTINEPLELRTKEVAVVAVVFTNESGDVRVARLLATLNQELKVVGFLVLGKLNIFWY